MLYIRSERHGAKRRDKRAMNKTEKFLLFVADVNVCVLRHETELRANRMKWALSTHSRALAHANIDVQDDDIDRAHGIELNIECGIPLLAYNDGFCRKRLQRCCTSLCRDPLTKKAYTLT